MKTINREYRYLFLILACFSSIGNYFIMDTPALLKTQMVQQLSSKLTLQQSEMSYSLLYSVYSLPNIVLPLFSGIFIDMYGDQLMTLVFVIFIVLGQICFAFGTETNSIYFMILGRFLQGIGGESQQISIQTLTIKWFSKDNLNFSQALELSFLRLASICNAIITPYLSAQYGMQTSINFGLVICFISLSTTIGLVYMDYQYEDQNQEKQALNYKELSQNWKKLTPLFKNLCYLTSSLYMSYQTFTMFISAILIEDHLPSSNSTQINQEIAGRLIAIPFFIATIFSPIIGMFVDIYGHRINLLIMSVVLMFAGYVQMLQFQSVVSMALLGVSLAIFSTVVWATSCFLVNRQNLGMALGIMMALQNFGTGVAPILIISVKNYFGENRFIMYQLIALSIISLYFILKLRRLDQKKAVSLNSYDQDKLFNQLEQSDISYQPIQDL